MTRTRTANVTITAQVVIHEEWEGKDDDDLRVDLEYSLDDTVLHFAGKYLGRFEEASVIVREFEEKPEE